MNLSIPLAMLIEHMESKLTLAHPPIDCYALPESNRYNNIIDWSQVTAVITLHFSARACVYQASSARSSTISIGLTFHNVQS